MVFQLRLEHLLHLFVTHLLVPPAEPELVLHGDPVGAHVAGHNEDHVLEVYMPAEGIGETTLLHDLQKHVEHVWMGLLDLVEQDHRIGAPPDALRKLAAFLVSHIARRGADQTGDVVLLHVLRHVQHVKRLGFAEHELGQALGQIRLAHAGRTDENERPHRSIGILEPAATSADSPGDGADGFVLADHLLVQFVFEGEESIGLVPPHAAKRDARHRADDLGNHFLVHDSVDFLVAVPPLLLQDAFLVLDRVDLVANLGGPFVVGVLDRFILFSAELIELVLQLGQIGGLRHGLETHAGARFIHDVDGFVRLDPGHVPGR